MTSAELQILIRARDEASRVIEGIVGRGGALHKLNDRLLDMAKVAAISAVGMGTAVAAVGAAALKFAGDFDEAFDAIRIGTGATGAQLESLQQSFNNVARNVPNSFRDVGLAIAELNTRLGLTGPPLEKLADQFLNLSRITGINVTEAIRLGTRVFGDWGVAADQQSAVLDKLFRATQVTGIGFDRLSQLIVQFGAPLRQMGFSINKAIALLGKWEKEGVNVELVLGSLRIAMGEFARQGIPMRQGLEQTIARIRELGPSAKATRLAMEVFGARAGPDMAAAILEGRFAIEDYLKVIESGKDTINGVAEETMDWGERLAILKNRVLIALQPVLVQLFDAVTNLVMALAPLVEAVAPRLAQLFERNVSPALDAASARLGEIAKKIDGELIPAAIAWWQDHGPKVTGTLETMGQGAKAVLDALEQFGGWLTENKAALIGAISAIGAAFVWVNPLTLAFIGAGGLLFALGLFRTSLEALPAPLLAVRREIDGLAIRLLETTSDFLQFVDVVTSAGLDLIPGFQTPIDSVQGKLAELRERARADLAAVIQQEEALMLGTKNQMAAVKVDLEAASLAYQQLSQEARAAIEAIPGGKTTVLNVFKSAPYDPTIQDALNRLFSIPGVRDTWLQTQLAPNFEYYVNQAIGILQRIPDTRVARIVIESVLTDPYIAQALAIGRQHGGPVWPGRPFLVGERGPELFFPSTRGYIAPLERMRAAVASAPVVNVNLTIEGDVVGELGFEQRITQIVRDAIRSGAFRGVLP